MSDTRRTFGQVFERAGRWYAKWPSGRTPAGRTRYKTRAVSTKGKGLMFLQELRKASIRGLLPETPQNVGTTVEQEAECYIEDKRAEGRAEGTLQQYGINLKAYRASGLSGIAIQRLTDDDVRAHMRWRLSNVWQTRAGKCCKVEGGKASNAVLKRDRAFLSAICARLVRAGRLVRNPVAMVAAPKVAQKPRRYLDNAEIQRLIAECRPELRPLAICGLYLGARGSELIAIRWRDVSFKNGTVIVVREKNGTADTLPMAPVLSETLHALKRSRVQMTGRLTQEDDAVFWSRYKRAYRRFPEGAWKGAIKRAGLSGRKLTPHCMRHTVATLWKGADRDLQHILGHADLKTTLIYRKSLDGRTREAVESIDYGIDAQAHSSPNKESKAQ